MFVQKYSYSRISSESVEQLVKLTYSFPGKVSCRFYMLGLHDTYLIESANRQYILRIFRRQWRSTEDVQFELELLAFLGSKNAPVAAPVLSSSGELSFSIDCPEGPRHAVLFDYAKGYAPGNDLSVGQCTLLGTSIAKIHQISDSFKTKRSRQVLDIAYLLDESISVIRPFIDNQAQEFVENIKELINAGLPVLPRETAEYGICIGDVNANNFHIYDNKQITVFDFDQCGYGHRAFEIGKFASSIQFNDEKQELVNAFIDAYQEVRCLSVDEVLAIPYYELVSIIWVMAIHVNNVEQIGYKYLEKPFWDRRLLLLKKLVHAFKNKNI